MATNPSEGPSHAETEAPPQAEAQEILARYGATAGAADPGQGAPAPGTDAQPPGAAGAAEPQPLTGKHVVDWGGTPREVEINDLVQRAMATENASTLHQAAQAEMEKLGVLKALDAAQKTWTPEQQQAFAQVVQNPSLLENLGQQPPPPEGEDLEPLEMDMRSRDQRPANDPLQQKIDVLAQVVQNLAQREQGRDQEQQMQDLDSRVTQTMQSFSLFDKDPDALQAYKKYVKDHMVLNPDANLEHVVADHARQAQQMIQGRRAAVAQQAQGEQGASVVPIQLPPSKLPFGRQVARLMDSGHSIDHASAAFNRLMGDSA